MVIKEAVDEDSEEKPAKKAKAKKRRHKHRFFRFVDKVLFE